MQGEPRLNRESDTTYELTLPQGWRFEKAELEVKRAELLGAVLGEIQQRLPDMTASQQLATYAMLLGYRLPAPVEAPNPTPPGTTLHDLLLER